MTDEHDELCPCGSGKLFSECCDKEYKRIMAAREKIKAALADPKKQKELGDLLKQAKNEDDPS